MDVDDVIQDGVKETIDLEMDDEGVVEYYIKNSVKETTFKVRYGSLEVEDTIQNGVNIMESVIAIR